MRSLLALISRILSELHNVSSIVARIRFLWSRLSLVRSAASESVVGGSEEQSQRLDEIEAGALQGVALACYVEFRAEGYVPVSVARSECACCEAVCPEGNRFLRARLS